MCIDAGVGEAEGYRDRKGVVVYGTCRVVGDDETVSGPLTPEISLETLARTPIGAPTAGSRWTRIVGPRGTSGRSPRGPIGSLDQGPGITYYLK